MNGQQSHDYKYLSVLYVSDHLYLNLTFQSFWGSLQHSTHQEAAAISKEISFKTFVGKEEARGLTATAMMKRALMEIDQAKFGSYTFFPIRTVEYKQNCHFDSKM